MKPQSTDHSIRVIICSCVQHQSQLGGCCAGKPFPFYTAHSSLSRPDPEGKKNVVLVGGANGELQLWHVTSKRCIYKTVEICDTTQEPNAIYAADYQRNGKFLATAGASMF